MSLADQRHIVRSAGWRGDHFQGTASRKRSVALHIVAAAAFAAVTVGLYASTFGLWLAIISTGATFLAVCFVATDVLTLRRLTRRVGRKVG